MAPAASVGPSEPSVPALKTTTRSNPAIYACDLEGGGERELLVASAEPIALDGDGGFAARYDAGGRPHGSPGGGDLAGDSGVHTRDLAGLALDGAGEDQRAVAELAGGAGGGVERQAVAAHHGIAHAGEQRGGGLGRLGDFAARALLDAVADGGRHAMVDGVAVENGAGGGEGGSVGSGGAGTDDVEIVADDIGKQQGFHAGGGGQARQLPALDARDVLTDGVDLVDGGARGQQQAGGGLVFLEGDTLGGRGQEGKSAEAPPETRQITRSSRPAAAAICAIRTAPATPRSSGTGWPHWFNSMRRNLATWPSLTLIRPAVMRRPRTRSAACAMEAPALPAPIT